MNLPRIWSLIVALSAATIAGPAVAAAEKVNYFTHDALGGTLARDHQSRAMFFAGKHRRTYVAYLDHHFNARVTFYDHDTKRWAFPTRVDTCIRGTFPDGHNAPNLWVSKDGTVHLFYGSHNHSLKYARSRKPESIGKWQTGMRVGQKATYPYLAETTDGQLLLFYRYGPTGGYRNPFLVVHHSRDGGKTWGKATKLVTFPTGCKIWHAAYDPIHDRVHLLLWVPVKPWTVLHCAYAPASGEVFALNGQPVGPIGTWKEFTANQCQVSHDRGGDMCLFDGRPYFLYRDKKRRIRFGKWAGQGLAGAEIPARNIKGLNFNTVSPQTADGKTFRFYGISVTDPPTQCNGGDLVVWTSTDAGKTWDAGKTLFDRRKLGHGLEWVNPVMNYAGSGPVVIVSAECLPSGPRKGPKRFDVPHRRDRRLYALDAEGKFIANAR